MKRLINSLITAGALLLLASCSSGSESPNIQLAQSPSAMLLDDQNDKYKLGAKSKATGLDSLRTRMIIEYAKVKPVLIEQKTLPDPGPGQQPPCKSCDIPFLARVSQQREVSQLDFNYLLCTVHDQCRNNVEFLEFYNEQLFRFTLRQPAQFLQGLTNQSVMDSARWKLIAFELANPVTEDYTTEQILVVLEQSNNQFDQKFRQPLGTLRKLIIESR